MDGGSRARHGGVEANLAHCAHGVRLRGYAATRAVKYAQNLLCARRASSDDSSYLRASTTSLLKTHPLDVWRQPKARQAGLPEAHLDDTRMSAAILRLSRLEAARYDDRAVLCGIVPVTAKIIAAGSIFGIFIAPPLPVKRSTPERPPHFINASV